MLLYLGRFLGFPCDIFTCFERCLQILQAGVVVLWWGGCCGVV
jgi:hypothetical protein